ncbi:MAG: DUF736 family protein [Hyphococcus sp.]
MAEVGQMEVKSDENGLRALGKIRTLKASLSFLVTPDKASDRERAPTHRIEVKQGEEWFKIGVAWVREMQRGDNVGKPMFSLSLEDPDLPGWMSNLAAFPAGVRGEGGAEIYEIVHQRERQQAQQGEAA